MPSLTYALWWDNYNPNCLWQVTHTTCSLQRFLWDAADVPFGMTEWSISIVRYTNLMTLPSGNQYPEIERRRYHTHRWQCCRRETYNSSSKRSSNHNWSSWPSLQSWGILLLVWEWLIFTIFFLWSSLLERSSFFQTCSILRRLAKRCVHTVQRWWVLLTRGPLKCSFFNRLSRPSRLSRKKVNLLFY